MNMLGNVRRKVAGIPDPQAVFDKPGFAPECWDRFGPVISSLAAGYNATLEDSSLDALIPRLEAGQPSLLGFAYEGAAMGLGALDAITFSTRRIRDFAAGPGARHIATVYVGLGLALARLRRRPENYLDRLDPVLGWAVVDGYGFHEGFFARSRSIGKQVQPTHLSSHGRAMFDQGLGRSIWFAGGAGIGGVAQTINAFEPGRRGSLWTGAAMACSFAGGTDAAGLEQLRDAAGMYRQRLAWAAATAAWTRDLAGNPTPHTDQACEVLCEISSSGAARILEQCRRDLRGVPISTSYQAWRDSCVPQLLGRLRTESS